MERAKPMPYQSAGVEAIEAFNGRALLADEMGLGKTLQALWYLERNPKAMPCVVVCPAGLKYNWEREAITHCGIRATILSGERPDKDTLNTLSPLTIINYDILDKWLPYLLAHQIETVILDECQAIQNPNARRSKATKALAKSAARLIALSGTPLTNRPYELYSVLNLIRPDIYTSRFAFAQRYCRPVHKPWGWEYKGATNLPELHGRLKKDMMIRRLKADVLGDLPAKVRRVVQCPLDDPNGHYEAAKCDFLGWLEKQSIDKFVRASAAEQITKLTYLKGLAARFKYKATIEWIDSFLEEQPGEKIVLFVSHTKFAEALSRRYAGRCVSITGATSMKDRQANCDAFQTDPKKDVMIGQIEAAGVGWTFTAAKTVAFLELDWRPGLHIQAEDRIHRIGQLGVAWIYYLIAGGTIEMYLCDIIQDKQDAISTVLDGKEHNNRLNVFEMMTNRMREGFGL